jgi:hypothetical protein
MQLPDKQLAYVLNNACLAMYAKMGGTPWKIPSDANLHHEVVFGIGSKVFKNSRFGAGKKIVGITTVFSGDGAFLLGSRSNVVPFESYFETLKLTVRSDLEKIKKHMGWETGETVRLVFHLFKPFKRKEILAIQEAVKELTGEYNLSYAYLTFAEQHPWLLIDRSQPGISDWNYPGKFKGIFQPERDSTFKIDDYQFLLQLKGPKDVKTFSHGYSRPLLLKLHPLSTFVDMEYLVRQTSRFATNSWRSFFPGSLPVTIAYSNQIAELVELMVQSTHLNRATISDKRLDHKVWFL